MKKQQPRRVACYMRVGTKEQLGDYHAKEAPSIADCNHKESRMNSDLEQAIKQVKEELGIDDAQWEKVRNEVRVMEASQPKSRVFCDPLDKTFVVPRRLAPCTARDSKVKKTYSARLKSSLQMK